LGSEREGCCGTKKKGSFIGREGNSNSEIKKCKTGKRGKKKDCKAEATRLKDGSHDGRTNRTTEGQWVKGQSRKKRKRVRSIVLLSKGRLDIIREKKERVSSCCPSKRGRVERGEKGRSFSHTREPDQSRPVA